MKNTVKTNDSIAASYKRLLVYARPYRGRLALGIIFSILFGGSTGAVIPAVQKVFASFEKTWISEVPLGMLVGAAVLVLLLTALRGIGFFCSKYFIQWVGSRVVMDIRNSMFDHIHRLPMQFFSRSRTGELISRLTADTGMVQGLVSNVVGDLLREPCVLISAIVVLFWNFDWRLTATTLLVFPVCLIPVSIFGRKVRKASKLGQEKTADLLSQAQESIGGAQIVKAFGMEDEEVGKFAGHAREVFKRLMKIARAQASVTPLMELFSAVGMVLVLAFAFSKGLPLSEVFSFILAMVVMYKPAKTLSKLYLQVQQGMAGATRIFDLLDTQVLIEDKPDAVELLPQIERVDFKEVGFSYDEEAILSDINLSVKAGECVAFVGSSGAGKTTLVNLLPRFFDVKSGAISINGHDIRDYTVRSLREQVGIVTQQTILFNLSVAENISYGQPEATREDIIAAAKRANAHEFIEKMDLGYDTVIGERGSRVSGGQAQRLAIARALLKNPPVLILDEATSALDTESERLVQAALDELMSGRTVFVIAHRLSTVRHADKIVVMDQGRIVETGTHDELLSKGGKYKYLYDIQFRNAEEV
ncbi:ABC transporter ATP-binding protein [Verrucomicrobiota bacterium]